MKGDFHQPLRVLYRAKRGGPLLPANLWRTDLGR
jgi:hypothetical protein